MFELQCKDSIGFFYKLWCFIQGSLPKSQFGASYFRMKQETARLAYCGTISLKWISRTTIITISKVPRLIVDAGGAGGSFQRPAVQAGSYYVWKLSKKTFGETRQALHAIWKCSSRSLL